MAEFQFRTRDTDSGSNGLNGTSTSETVPSSQNVSIDSLGFLDTWSFAWVRSFYVKSLPICVESDPEKNINHTGEGVKPTLNISSSDSTHTNVDYFQDLYRHEEDLHGKINASMLRVCFALCRNRLLLASGAYLLYLLTVIVAITVFLREVMWATNQHFLIILNRYHEYYERDYSESNQTAHDILNTTPEDAKHLLLHNIYFSVPFVLMMVFAYMQRSFYEGKLLSTAIMLRNACAGAVFESSLKSSVQTNVASYQILTLCGEDGDAILEFIQKGVLVVVQTLGVSICMICGFFMVGFSTIWPTIGLSVLLLIAYLLSMASAAFYRKSLTFQMQKLSIADEYCQRSATNSAVGPEANNSTLLGQREIYRNRFAAATSGQFWALFRSEALRPSFSGAITLLIMLVFLTIVSAIYHETNAREDTHNLVALGFLLVYLVCNLVSDWSESMSALIKGFAVFDKVKTYLTRPLPIQPVNSPDDTTLKLSIQAATFKWETALKTAIDKEPEQPAPIEKTPFSLDVKQFSVMKNSIVGITGDDGSGKSSLVLALLGHMPHRSGDYRRSGSMSYYPEKPYVLHDCSIQMNIMFNGEQNAKLNESRYKEAVSTVQIHMNQGFDSIPMAGHALDEQWLQRISLARALYEESDNTIILENPLSGLDSNTEISDVFSDVATKLLELNKTVIVVSQDDNVLRHCQHIFLVDNGIVKDNSFTYDKIKSNAVFKEIIRNNRNQRELLRNGNLTNNLQTNLNLSTEDLVANEIATASGPPSIFNPIETIYLIILNVFLAFIQTTLPLMDMVVYLIYDKVLAFVTMGFCFCLLIFNILGKHYVHRTARRSTKRLQRGIFDRLLHTPSSAVNESFGVLCLNAMLESNFRAFSVRASTIHSSMIIVFAILNLFVINGFWSLYSIVMIIQVVGIYFAFRHTMSSASELETSNRLKLYENVHNDLAGRVVLQSFNHIRESRNRIFDLMDTHSSSVYLIKSIIFFAQFIFTLFQVLNLPPQIIIVYHDVFNDDTSYMIALYLFFLMTHHIYKMIEVRLHSIITDQKLQRAHQFKVVSEDISTLKFT